MSRVVKSNKGEHTVKKYGARIFAMAVYMLLGVAGGVGAAQLMDMVRGEPFSLWTYLAAVALALVAFYAGWFLQVVIHEAGHLVGGLWSGYRFGSFRVGSLMWIRKDGGLRLRRLSLAGTAGQCLMCPPDLVDGKIPVVLYNLGGSLANLASLPLCALGCVLCRDLPFAKFFFLMTGGFGLATALTNGIPLRLGALNNDGRNALDLGKSPEAMKAFWVQMKVAEQSAQGRRLKDMPEEWFAMPEERELGNGLVAVQAVFRENRLMDEGRFGEAAALTDYLLERETGIIGIHKNLLICDRTFCELIGGRDPQVLERFSGAEMRKFRKQMGSFLTVLRTEYAWALLQERDEKKAAKWKMAFEKRTKTYPYPADLESERALMALCEKVTVS